MSIWGDGGSSIWGNGSLSIWGNGRSPIGRNYGIHSGRGLARGNDNISSWSRTISIEKLRE